MDPSGFKVGAQSHSQSDPSVAFDGTNSLVVWADLRAFGGTHWDVYCGRVEASGSLKDTPNGVKVKVASGDQGAAHVSFDSSQYLVTWGESTNKVNGHFMNKSAQLQGTEITIASNYKSSNALAFNGKDHLALWIDSTNTVYGARVSTAGTVLDKTPANISKPSGSGVTGNQNETDVACNGIKCLAVWTDDRNGSTTDIYGTLIDQSMGIAMPKGIAISTAAADQEAPKVTAVGSDFFVVWVDKRTDTSGDIYGARVTSTGKVQDASGVPISTATGKQLYCAVAADSQGAFVTWSDQRTDAKGDLYGARVSLAGEVAHKSGIPILAHAGSVQSQSDLVLAGTHFLVVWSDSRWDSGDITDVAGARVKLGGP